jgi:hypothetical protein
MKKKETEREKKEQEEEIKRPNMGMDDEKAN